MRKSFIFFTIFIIIGGILIGIFLILNTDKGKEITQEILKKREVIDVIERSQQYNLLYSQNLQNSLQPTCNWNNLEFDWEFPDIGETAIYKTAFKTTVLEEDIEELEKVTYNNEQDAVDRFFEEYPNIKSNLEFDYIVEIYSNLTSTYEKMPLFSIVNDKKILTTQLGIWRNEEEKYVAGLYEVSNEFKSSSFNKQVPYLSSPVKSEDKVKKMILDTNIKFLNHEFLCESDSITKVNINSVEIVYLHQDEYLMPVYKITGTFIIDSEEILWTALIDAIDYTQLDYTSYYDSKLKFTFIPRPYIANTSLDDDKYIIEGILSNSLLKLYTDKKYVGEDIRIEFIATEKTGEYIFDKRKDDLENEIVESLRVEEDGKFSLSFSSDNFWIVEEIIYEDENGNEIEPYHSQEIEINRPSYDNSFKIRVCASYAEEEYCTESLENTLSIN